nr:DUF397 domain-containing protein [Actinoplanes derwentensis]
MESTSGPAWRKSSRCGTSTCIEVAPVNEQVWIRDSKTPEADPLQVSRRPHRTELTHRAGLRRNRRRPCRP